MSCLPSAAPLTLFFFYPAVLLCAAAPAAASDRRGVHKSVKKSNKPHCKQPKRRHFISKSDTMGRSARLSPAARRPLCAAVPHDSLLHAMRCLLHFLTAALLSSHALCLVHVHRLCSRGRRLVVHVAVGNTVNKRVTHRCLNVVMFNRY